jgi:hypothetical protein
MNEHGEEISVDLADTDIDYRVDRITDLVREMAAGGRDMGPPPKPGDGEARAWMGEG